MGSIDIHLAASALAIALVALLTALGQLLQQYFATADGYRRCQKSVMGYWATRTRLRWRWREFRFETLFTTPEIFLTGNGAPVKEGQILIIGSDDSRKLTMSSAEEQVFSATGIYTHLVRGLYGYGREATKNTRPNPRGKLEDSSDELACWHPLLHWIHNTTEASIGNEHHPPLKRASFTVRLPALVFRERSWDFQPLDVTRPLAKSTVSDIAVIARRMGMRWKDFRPADGIMRAEGHSHIITSTIVRSLGIVIQYSYTGQGQRLTRAERNLGRTMAGSLIREQEEVYIPTPQADRLGSGVIRGEPALRIPDFVVGTQQETITALRTLDSSGRSASASKALIRDNPDFHLRMADIVAMTIGMIRLRGTSLVQVPAPADNVFGFTTDPNGRRAFRTCLEHYVAKHNVPVDAQTQLALKTCCELSKAYPEWDTVKEVSDLAETWAVRRSVHYLDAVHNHFTSLTAYLEICDHDRSSFKYLSLLGLHIRLAIFRLEGDTFQPRGETDPQRELAPDYGADMEGYFAQLPKIVDMMQMQGLDAKLVVDTWTSMMLRACCWGACHFFVPGERVPTAYYGSQLPVYIG